jgi:hypothetical protein
MGVKKYRNGKHLAYKRHPGSFSEGNAGVVREFLKNHAGVLREFIGSGTKEYNFYKKGVGILTVMAHSWEEALRLAKSRGFTSRNYMR